MSLAIQHIIYIPINIGGPGPLTISTATASVPMGSASVPVALLATAV